MEEANRRDVMDEQLHAPGSMDHQHHQPPPPPPQQQTEDSTRTLKPKPKQKRHRHKHPQKQQQNNNNNNSKPNGPPRARKLSSQPRTADMPRILGELLSEPKQALLHRVVRIIGPKLAWGLLKETVRVEQQGGQEVNAVGSGVPDKFLVQDTETQEKKPRKRTTGGIYFTLLRGQVSKEMYREIYEVENKKKKEAKNRLRYQKKQRFEKEISQLGFDVLNIEQTGGSAEQASGGAGNPGSSEPLTVPFHSSYDDSGNEQEDGEVDEMCD
ncbi:Phosphorylated adapter RNA export protein [Globisporangium polare]